MALKDAIALGMSLPHRSPQTIEESAVRRVAQRAEALGFQDLWVTNNTIDHAGNLDSFTVLTYAAALTTRIRLGVSVLVLPVYHPIHVAHQVATLDRLSNGRAILGVGLGRADEYAAFGVPTERRVRRFTEAVALMKALWTESPTTYHGEIFSVDNLKIGARPVQTPYPPIWVGSHHPAAVRRAALLSDGWMGAGGSTNASFKEAVPLLHAALAEVGRDPATFPISKRVFLSVHERADVARAEVHAWFSEVYHNPSGTETAGIFGTPAQVQEQLETLAAQGATHLLLNPVTRYEEQVEALGEIVGLGQ